MADLEKLRGKTIGLVEYSDEVDRADAKAELLKGRKEEVMSTDRIGKRDHGHP